MQISQKINDLNILFVDDIAEEFDIIDQKVDYLNKSTGLDIQIDKLEFTSFENVKNIIEYIDTNKTPLVLMDHHMPTTGIDVIKYIRHIRPQSKANFALFTHHENDSNVIEEAHEIQVKPYAKDEDLEIVLTEIFETIPADSVGHKIQLTNIKHARKLSELSYNSVYDDLLVLKTTSPNQEYIVNGKLVLIDELLDSFRMETSLAIDFSLMYLKGALDLFRDES